MIDSNFPLRLIARKGRPLVLRRRDDAVASDPSQPWAVERGGPHDHQMYGVVLDYEERYVDGELIKLGDKRVLVAAIQLVIEPAPRDTLFDGDEEWTVIDVEVHQAAGAALLYVLQIRR